MVSEIVPERDPLAPYDAVLVLSYGGPQGPEDVLPFMRNATAGRGVPDERLLEVSGHYGRFGGVSPINARNAELIEALRAELASRGSRVPVVIGNRNWFPFVSQALRELADAGARRVLAMTTSAYASYSGCRQYREDAAAAVALLAEGADGSTGRGREADAAARVGGRGGEPVTVSVDKTRPFYNTPGMLAANADAIAEAVERLVARGVDPAGIRLALVTHSVPLSMEAGSVPQPADAVACGGEGSRPGQVAQPEDVEPGMSADLSTEISYVTQHERFIEALLPAVRERLEARGLPGELRHDLVFCSRSGPPQARWLEPDVNDYLDAVADGRQTDGTPIPIPSGVVAAPIGFVADHMEVVFDLDTEARQTAQDLAMPYERAATAGTHPQFVASLVDVLCERAAVARGEDVVPVSTTGTGPFHTVCPAGCCSSGAPHGSGRPAHRAGSAPHPADSAPHPAGTPGLPARPGQDHGAVPRE